MTNSYKADSSVISEIARKVKAFIQGSLDTKANSSDVNTALASKANAADVYTKSEVNDKLGEKADSSTAVTHTASAAAGSATQPVYVNASGVVTPTTYSLAKSVPSDAKFTDTTYSDVTTSAHGLMTAADKTKLNGIAASANNYIHPTTSGNKHIPSGGSSGQILRWSADGTAAWGADNNTTYSAATTSAQGLMSAADKTKLNAISDYITSYGTSGIWTWVKLSNKFCVLWGTREFASNSSTGIVQVASTNYPFTVSNAKGWVSGMVNGYSNSYVSYVNVGSTFVDAYMYKPATAGYYARYLVIGTC